MLVEGFETVRRKVEVDISPYDLILTLEKSWKETLGVNRSWDINAQGMWVEWVDTHASGFDVEHREATQEEIEMRQSFNKLYEFARKMKETKR